MKKALLLAILAGSAYFANAQTISGTTHEISPKALRQLDSLYHYLDTSGLYNGNILVGIGGQKVSAASIGFANLETKEKLTAASPFELASVSKQFTAVGILRLVDAGKLRLDQTLESLYPSFPYKGVTIRHLLNHTGGLPSYEQMFAISWDRKKIATNTDIIKELTRLHPKEEFAPGTKYAYSNTGYAMLAAVIEKVSGKSYADYMREQVFKPLHLDHTFIYMRRYAPKKVKGYAYGYVKNEAGGYALPDSIDDYSYVRYLDGIGGDGTVNTTTGDLFAWNNAVRRQAFLPANLWKEALTAPVVNGKSSDYGFGWQIVMNPERGKVLRHTGGWPGYVTNNVLYLDKDVSLIFLTNKEQSPGVTQGTYDAVKNIVFGLPFAFPEPLKAKAVANIDKKVYERYVGTYFTEEMQGFELNVFAREGRLFVQATGQSALEISPESETRFFVPDFPIGFEFRAERDKPASSVILLQNGVHEFKRK